MYFFSNFEGFILPVELMSQYTVAMGISMTLAMKEKATEIVPYKS